MNTRSPVDVWVSFFTRHFLETFQKIYEDDIDTESLLVEFSKIENFDIDLANELLENPDRVLKDANDALSGMVVDAPVNLGLQKELHTRVVDLPKQSHITVNGLRGEHNGQLIAIRGIVKKVAKVNREVTVACFRCARCETETFLPIPKGVFQEPFDCDNDACGRRGPFNHVTEESTFVDFQKMRIQDPPDEMRANEKAQHLDVDMRDDLTGRLFPGNRIVIVGVLRSYQISTKEGKSTLFDYCLDAVSVTLEETGFEDIELTEQDEKDILGLGADPNILQKIVASVAPSIYGYEDIKEAIALQLFSGIPKKLPDGTRLRGDIHVLLAGDPGAAKSQLLRYARTLAPRGIFASGKNSTAAGLTATAVKDDFKGGMWDLEPGALVLADRGLACVDEIDKMRPEDRSALHEAMEQQTISIAKAGINVTLNARCALLGAANPKYGRFDRYEPFPKQITLESTLLSRFDLIFLVLDEPEVAKDTAIADHIFKIHYYGELLTQQQNVHKHGITQQDLADAATDIQPDIPAAMLRKYIAYAKKNIFPRLTPEAWAHLRALYLDLRRQGIEPNSPVPITARSLEALIRLAEASARARLSLIISESDALRVVRLVMASLKQVMTDPETGKLDSDIISSGMGKSQRDRIKVLRKIIREIQTDLNSAAPLADVMAKAIEAGIPEKTIEDMITKLKSVGEIIEASNERYRVA